MQVFIYTFLAAWASFFSSVAAVPITLYARDVFVPPILTPNESTVWTSGTTAEVTWDTSNPPQQITNTKGKIVFVKDGRLDYYNPLASGFDILLGKYNITVPNVEPGNEYQIVLFGDSGNFSKKFTIVAPTNSPSPSPPTSSPSTSTDSSSSSDSNGPVERDTWLSWSKIDVVQDDY